jgi:PAS domain S-box-containing protein
MERPVDVATGLLSTPAAASVSPLDPASALSLLQALADASPDPVFAKDREGRYVLLNQAAAEALGRPIEAVLGQDDRALFAPEVAATLMANDQVALGMGRSEQYQESILSAGVIRTHLVRKSPYFDATGAVAGLVCTAKDIGDEGQAREGRAAQLTGIIRMQEAVADPALGVDEVIRRVVERTMDLLEGTGASAFLEQNGELFCPAAAGVVAGVEGHAIEISTTLAGRAYLESVALRCRDTLTDRRVDGGIYRQLNIRSVLVVPLRGGLQTVGVLSLIHEEPDQFSDEAFQALILIGGLLSGAIARAEAFARNQKLVSRLTTTLDALSANEERFRSAVDAAELAVWDWDLVVGEIAWLGHCDELFGIEVPRFGARFDNFMGTVHPDDQAGAVEAIEAALATHTEYSHSQRIVWPDGSVRWIMGRGKFHRDAAGAPVRMVGAALDVTERRRLEGQLLQAQKIEAIGQLAAGVAHEINTPIQYVADNLRFLEDAFRDLNELLTLHREGAPVEALATRWRQLDGDFIVAQVPLATAQGLEGAERVASIVRAMKEFAHPGREDMAPVDLNRAVSNTVSVSRNEWRYVADLELELDPGLPPVPCLQGEIQQVVLNLIVNAAHAIADAGREEKGRITVTTRTAGTMAEIVVQDSGTGIPEAVRARVFDPFFTTKEVGRGTGQGLALAHDTVVKKHGGSLEFSTEVGKGSSFVVRLPLERPTTQGLR